MDNTPFKLPARCKEPPHNTDDSGLEEKDYDRGRLHDAKAQDLYERDKRLQDKFLSLKSRVLGIGGIVALAILLLLALIAVLVFLYLVFLWLLDSTGPAGASWLIDEQRTRLANLYASVSGIGFPIAMIVNGWLIWLASRGQGKGRN